MQQPQLISPSPSYSMVFFFFCSLARFRYSSLISLSFIFTLKPGQDNKVHYSVGSLLFFSFFFFLVAITWSGHLAEIRCSVCISKSLGNLCVSFSRTDFGFWVYHLLVWSNLNFFYNSQWNTFCAQSYLVLYPFYANLLHSLII